MKKFIFGLSVIIMGCSKRTPLDTSMVYICTDPTMNSYHSDKNCSSLRECHKDILYVEYSDRNTEGRNIKYNNKDSLKIHLFYIPEDETVYEAREDIIYKHREELEHAIEYTKERPSEYFSEVRYFEKNGVLITITKDKEHYIKDPSILKDPTFYGSREIYPMGRFGEPYWPPRTKCGLCYK